MPTYQYQCRNCGHEMEEFQSISEPPSTRCPECLTDNLVRVLGGGAGLIFKGSGFYLTDYKKTSSPPAAGPREDSGAKPAGETAPPKSGTAEKKGGE